MYLFCLSSDEATIFSGTKLAKQVLKEVQRDVESWISFGNKRPHLTVILVGDNPASHTYVRNKIKAAAAVGMFSCNRDDPLVSTRYCSTKNKQKTPNKQTKPNKKHTQEVWGNPVAFSFNLALFSSSSSLRNLKKRSWALMCRK